MDLEIGDRIEYRTNARKERGSFSRSGVVVDRTDKLIVLDLGRYRDTILLSDLKIGDVKITGGEFMARGKKIEPPSAEYLADLWERSGKNVHRAVKNCGIEVSATTMRTWLKDAGIVPPAAAASEIPADSKNDNPKPSEPENESSKNESDAGEPRNVSQTEEFVNVYGLIEEMTRSQRQMAERLIALEKSRATIEEPLSPDAVKKTFEFLVSPFGARMDRLEESVAAKPEGRQNPVLDFLADLLILVLRKASITDARG